MPNLDQMCPNFDAYFNILYKKPTVVIDHFLSHMIDMKDDHI